MPQLDQQQLDLWEQDGYLVIADFYCTAETGEMLAQARKLLSEFDPTDHPLVRSSHLMTPCSSSSW